MLQGFLIGVVQYVGWTHLFSSISNVTLGATGQYCDLRVML